MPRDPDRYDFFVSYASADNREGWVTAFVDALLAEQEKFSGGRKLTHFFDERSTNAVAARRPERRAARPE
jgi:hypothetical protein